MQGARQGIDERVTHIFRHFDTDNAGLLDRDKLLGLIQTFNQGVGFSERQLGAIVGEILEEYPGFCVDGKLTIDGLAQIYEDAMSDLDNDFAYLGLSLEDKALDLPAAASSANQNEEIDFEPEAQQDAFRLISEMKPIEPAQDAQSDTALSIGPRSDSTILRGTPPDGPDDLVLSTLEQELGLKRKGSGAESIASMTPQAKPGHQSLLVMGDARSSHDAKGHGFGREDNNVLPSLRLGQPSFSQRPMGDRLQSPSSTRVRSPSGRVADIVSRFEEASSPKAKMSPSFRSSLSERSAYFTPVADALGSLTISPGEKRKDASDPISPRPTKVQKEETKARPSDLTDAAETAARISKELFGLEGAKVETDFQEEINHNSENWQKATPSWSSIQVHQATYQPESTILNPKQDDIQGLKTKSLPLSLQKQRGLMHVLSGASRDSDQSAKIQAHTGGLTIAEEIEGEESDDVFDEVIGPMGQVIKYPSAISIEDRHSSLKRDSSIVASRMPSAASDLLEAEKPSLRIDVPPEISRVMEHSMPYTQSPGSTSVAEMEAQVGYESLDSQDIGALSCNSSPHSPSRGLWQKESPTKLMRAEMSSLMQINPSSNLIQTFQAKIEQRCGKSEASQLQLDLGRTLAKKGRHEDAIASYRAATSLVDGNAQAFLRLGNSLFSLERFAEAEVAFKRALKISEQESNLDLLMKIYTNLGITLEAMGLLLSACEHYRKATEIAPKHARAFKLLGGAHYALGNLELARRELEKAISLDSQYADAFCDLGCTLCASGHGDEAKEVFKKAITYDDRHVEAWFNLGNLERQNGQHRAALQCYKWVTQLEPRHWRALLNSAVAFIGLKRPQEAQVALQKALKLTGNHKAVEEEIKRVNGMSKLNLEALSDTATNVTNKMVDVPSPIKKALQSASEAGDLQAAELQSGDQIDLMLLKKLNPFSTVPTSKLHARAQMRAEVPAITQTEAEIIAHKLLQNLKPRGFTSVIGTFMQHILPHLEHFSQHNTIPGTMDRGLFLGVLIIISEGNWEDKVEALMEALPGRDGSVYAHSAAAFVKSTRAIFCSNHERDGLPDISFNDFLKTSDVLSRYLTSETSGLPQMSTLSQLARDQD